MPSLTLSQGWLCACAINTGTARRAGHQGVWYLRVWYGIRGQVFPFPSPDPPSPGASGSGLAFCLRGLLARALIIVVDEPYRPLGRRCGCGEQFGHGVGELAEGAGGQVLSLAQPSGGAVASRLDARALGSGFAPISPEVFSLPMSSGVTNPIGHLGRSGDNALR